MDEPKKTRDIWDFFDESDKRRAARPTYQKIWDDISRSLFRLWNRHLCPRSLWYGMVFFFQRRIRGFDDGDLGDLDYTILKLILPRLRRYREKDRNGWPGPEPIFDITDEEFQQLSEDEQVDLNDRSLEEWDRMLGKMIRAIELWLEHGGTFFKPNPEWKEGDSRRHKYIEDHELEAEYKEGWKLFIEWFHALWD